MDKRKHKRWYLTKPLAIKDKQSDENIGCVSNISTFGIGMISKNQFQPEDQCQLKIDLSNENFPIKDDIEIDAKSIWCKEQSTDRYIAGLKFADINFDIKRKIELIILHIGYTDQPLRYGKFS